MTLNPDLGRNYLHLGTRRKIEISSIFVLRNKIVHIPKTSKSELSLEMVKYGADVFGTF